jgi:glucose-1-phosphate thymidylyltransferase
VPVRPVGVVPAAGSAQRLQPLPCSKEVYPVGGRPVMDYVVERMRAAGCRELRVVTRPDKPDVAARARELGARVVEGEPASLAQSLVLGLSGLGDSDVVLVGLPDTRWEPIDGFVSLLAHLHKGVDAVLGVFDSDEPERSDVVVLDEAGLVRGIHVKEARPPGRLVWGCAAAKVEALGGLKLHDEPGHHFAALAATGRLRAVRLAGKLVDIGTPAALAAAEGRA